MGSAGLLQAATLLHSLLHLTTCLQSSAKMSSTVPGLGRSASQGPPEYGWVRARWCRLWVSSVR
jgi:hypothetical protein